MLDFEEIIDGLGKDIGLELFFDDNGICELLLDENSIVTIVKREEDNMLVLSKAVADALPDPADYSLVLDLLDFSLGAAISGGPAVGRDPESGLLVAWQIVTASLFKERSFPEVFHDFIAFAEGMTALISENMPAGSTENVDGLRA